MHRNRWTGHDRTVRLWNAFEEFIRGRGGIVARGELLDAGWDPDDIWFGRHLRRLAPLRHGWYGSADLPADVRRAWAAGGPLACISALVHLGELPTDDPRHADDVIHVALTAHGKVPETRGLAAIGLRVVHHFEDDGLHARLPVIARRDESHAPPARRGCVSAETAWRQLDRCRDLPRPSRARSAPSRRAAQP